MLLPYIETNTPTTDGNTFTPSNTAAGSVYNYTIRLGDLIESIFNVDLDTYWSKATYITITWAPPGSIGARV